MPDVTSAVHSTVVDYVVLALVGLGGVVFLVIKGMQITGLLDGKRGREMVTAPVKIDTDCVNGSELWNTHLPKFKQLHDELCGEKLQGIRKDLTELKAQVGNISEMRGQVNTILKILRKEGGT